MRRGLLSFTLLVFVLCAWPVAAQQYYFHTYNELDGLPSSSVRDIAQDRDGMLWFATARGLSCYDGTQWKDVGPEGNTPAVGFAFVGQDRQGRMWTASWDPLFRIHVLEGGVWRHVEFPSDSLKKMRCIAYTLGETPTGDVFLAMAERSGIVHVYEGGQWHKYGVHDGFVKIGAMAFVDGRLAIATEQGLFELDPADWRVRSTDITQPLHSVCAAYEGEGLWVVGEDWIGRRTADQLEVLATDLALRFLAASTGTVSVADQNGGLYFGDVGQVYYYHPGYGLELMSVDNGLQSGGLTSLFLDREGHVWVGCLRGVSKLVNRSLAGYDTRDGLFDDEVSAILRRRNGEMVLGHIGGLTFMGDPPRTVSISEETPNPARVMDLVETSDGEVWFAASSLGFGRVRSDETIEVINDTDRFAGVFALAIDDSGSIWVGANHGVYRFDGEEFEEIDLSPYVSSQALLIRRLVISRDGSLLIVSGNYGLFRLREGELTHYPARDSKLSDHLYNVFETMNGEILAGSVRGLYSVKGDSLEPTMISNVLIDNPIFGFLADTKGRLWIGTDKGVIRWNRETLTRLTNRDGLLGSETNRDALQLGPDGEVWIGTDRGLTIYRAEFDSEALAPPLVSITGFDIDGVRFPAHVPVELSRPARAIDINFRGITFRDEGRTTYRTWLENFEETWQGLDQVSSRSVRYTNVPPGRYHFHVQVVTADGDTSSEATSVPIVIQPPVTRRWWFVLVLVLIVVSVVWFATSYLSGRRHARRLKIQVRDRTFELENAEKHVRSESQRLGATLESISDGVITLDKEDRVITCNSAGESILGLSQADLVGEKLYQMLGVTPLVPLVPGEPTIHAMTNDDGRRSWVEFSVAPIVDPDLGNMGMVLAFRDITSRREMESQRVRAQQLESLGVLAGGIAHDFNNLLTIILGNISLVEEAKVVGEVEHGRLNKMKAATESARALTEQFLTFAKGGDPSLATSSMGELVTQSVALAFSGASVSCHLELAPDLYNVKVDRSQISQVLSNLLLNASHAMPDGGAVHVRAYNTEIETGDGSIEKWVCLEVRDRGVGIAKDDLQRIFDPYFTTKEHGTGLGLAIVHSVVRRHGGRLTVESELGSGSVFTLVLPATEGTLEQPQHIRPEDTLPTARVLLMDDEKDVLEICGRLLEILGVSSVPSENGEQALELYKAAWDDGMSFDAVIMDLTVPGAMGGKEAVQKLLEINPHAQVIVTSGYSKDPVMANYRRYGFQAALKKPFDRADLVQTLGSVLNKRVD